MQSLEITERPILQADDTGVHPVGYDFKDYLGSFAGASGQCIRLNIREGFDLSAFDLTLHQESYASHMMVEPCVSIYVMVSGKGHGEMSATPQAKTPLRIPYSAGVAYISILQKPMYGQSIVPQQTHFQGIDLRFSFSFLKKLKLMQLFDTLDAEHPIHLCSEANAWIGTMRNTRSIDTNVRYILNTALSSAANDLRLESVALNILSSVLENLEKAKTQKTERVLTQKEQRSIRHAMQLINADLAHHWLIDGLARQVGLNDKRLKVSFKAMNGVPIGRYIQQQRLSKAKLLINQEGMSVMETSLNVGYANPSHFAYLFKREFGYTPSTIK